MSSSVGFFTCLSNAAAGIILGDSWLAPDLTAGALSHTHGTLTCTIWSLSSFCLISMARKTEVKKKRIRNPVQTRAKLLQATIELKHSGKARADMDLEIMTYIMFGSIASTIMLGEQRKGDDVDELSERFTNQWNRILLEGIFLKGAAREIDTARPPRELKARKTALRR
jgi:hypothetical protein